jgi:hypothetical protein
MTIALGGRPSIGRTAYRRFPFVPTQPLEWSLSVIASPRTKMVSFKFVFLGELRGQDLLQRDFFGAYRPGLIPFK